MQKLNIINLCKRSENIIKNEKGIKPKPKVNILIYGKHSRS